MLSEVSFADQTSEYVSSSTVVETCALNLLELVLEVAYSGNLRLVSLSSQFLLLLVLSNFSLRSPTLRSKLKKICTDTLAC